MSIWETIEEIETLQQKQSTLQPTDSSYQTIKQELDEKKKEYEQRSAWDRVLIARDQKRPKAQDYIEALFDDFIELKGDRYFGEDASIIGGIGTFKGQPVTVLAESKGKTFEENMKKNFGMVSPEGYRKVIRLAKQAEKFKRPIITFVDTPGAYPGKGAEERGQAQAIATCLYEFSDIKVPVICIVLSEGGSGGALALSVANHIMMLENAIYSILSPEGFASILWKDESRTKEAAEVMKLTSYDLVEAGFVDEIVHEPIGGVQKDWNDVIDDISTKITNELKHLETMSTTEIVSQRQDKIRHLGEPVWIQ